MDDCSLFARPALHYFALRYPLRKTMCLSLDPAHFGRLKPSTVLDRATAKAAFAPRAFSPPTYLPRYSKTTIFQSRSKAGATLVVHADLRLDGGLCRPCSFATNPAPATICISSPKSRECRKGLDRHPTGFIGCGLK